MIPKLKDFHYDADRCIRCKGCKWVDHIYTPGVRFGVKCPSIARYLFDAYSAYGRMSLALGMLEGSLPYSKSLMDILYACLHCAACDIGCKRNLDLEIMMVLETMRIKACEDGQGPLPAHSRVAKNIRKSGNRYGSPHEKRLAWMDSNIKPYDNADILYFVGCNSSYIKKEIAQATAKILKAAGISFQVKGEEKCCGKPLYEVGLARDAIQIMEQNMEVLEQSGATTVLTSCAECYKMWKVDYPKLSGKSTKDMPYRVIHLVELVNDKIEDGSLSLKNAINLKVVYHDPCNLGRNGEDWNHWEGSRGFMGTLNPPKEYRRGTKGVYEPPRNILRKIEGIELFETPRHHENTWCCGAGGGVQDAFKEFALWTAHEKMEEVKTTEAKVIVSACPHCKLNFQNAAKKEKEEIEVYDIAEIIHMAIK